MVDHETEGKAFGMLLGLVGMRGMDVDDAIDVSVEKGADREAAERMAAQHFGYNNEDV